MLQGFLGPKPEECVHIGDRFTATGRVTLLLHAYVPSRSPELTRTRLQATMSRHVMYQRRCGCRTRKRPSMSVGTFTSESPHVCTRFTSASRSPVTVTCGHRLRMPSSCPVARLLLLNLHLLPVAPSPVSIMAAAARSSPALMLSADDRRAESQEVDKAFLAMTRKP